MSGYYADVLPKWGVTVAPPGHHHTRHGWTQTDCPWCCTWGKFHLGWNDTSHAVACWKCGGRSAFLAVKMLSPRADLGDVLNYLKTASVGRLKVEPKLRGKYAEPPGVGPLLPPHEKYIRRRRSDDPWDPAEIQSVWGIGGIGPVKPGTKLRIPWRLFLPVHVGGNPVTWTTRSIQPKSTLRYFAALPEMEDMPIKEILYGWDYVTHTVVVVEGPLDAWAVGPGAVATCGTSVTDHQITLLGTIPRRVILFDNGKAAQRRAQKLAVELACYPGTTEIVTIDGNDPASAPRAELEAVRRAFL
jgi:hypothetical protein